MSSHHSEASRSHHHSEVHEPSHHSEARESAHQSEASKSRHHSEVQEPSHHSEVPGSQHQSEAHVSSHHSEVLKSRHESEVHEPSHHSEAHASAHQSEASRSRHHSEASRSHHHSQASRSHHHSEANPPPHQSDAPASPAVSEPLETPKGSEAQKQSEGIFSTPRGGAAVPLFQVYAPDSESDSFNVAPRTAQVYRVAPPAGRSSSRQTPTHRQARRENDPVLGPLTSTPQTPNVDKLRQKAYKLEPLNASVEQLDQLIYALNQEKKMFVRDRRFKDSLKCSAAINHATEALAKAQKKEDVRTLAQRRLDAFDGETRVKEEDMLNRQKEARAQLKADQKSELSALSKRWNSPHMRSKYSKPSEKLQELKKQYAEVKDSGNEEEANELKSQIETIRKEEAKEAAAKMQRDYDEALNTLLQKQRQDQAFFVESSRVKLERFKKQRAKERRALEFRQMELEKANLKKVPMLTERYDSEEADKTQISVAQQEDESSATFQPDVPDSEKLELPPLDNRRPKSPRHFADSS